MSTRMQLVAGLLGCALFSFASGAEIKGIDLVHMANKEKDGYLYLDCADDGSGPPLYECAVLRISASLKDIYVDDFFEEDVPVVTDGEFRAIKSKHAPVAVPRENYEQKDSWLYSGRKYFKIKRSPTLVFGQETDVIAVVGNLDSLGGADKVIGINSFEALQNVVLTFWYDPKRGVEAIGVPRTVGDKAVYYCVRRPCLFASDH